jgi:hypothetical protein
MTASRLRAKSLGWVLGLILVAVVLLGMLALTRPLWSLFLFDVTGEESLAGQIRGGLEWLGDVTRPMPRTADRVPVANAGLNPFGANTFLQEEVEPEKRERTVQMIADAGFHWIRQEFPWEDIEIHGKGDFQDRRNEPYRSSWEKYDQIVDLADEYGLEVIARLSNPPAWSRAQGNEVGPFAPPDSLEDYGDFVQAVVRRYEGRIRYYQIWNEPNIYPEWGEQPVSPEEYTELLKVGYTRVKQACPECVVISGALAQTIPLGPSDLNDFIFLQRMYDAGAGDYFDVLAMQGYGLWSGPTDRRMRARVLNFSRPLYLREIMVNNGDDGKPIWLTEMNWNAPPPDLPDKSFGYVTPEQQARYGLLAYQRAQQEWPWVGVVNAWFFKRPTDIEQDQAMYYFRLVEPDFAPMPIYHTLKEYMTSQKARVLYPGVHQEDHWALVYEGPWETRSDPAAELGSYRYADAPQATLSFAFEGTDLWLRAGPDASGEMVFTLDADAPESSPLASGEQILLAENLGKGTHTITIQATPGPLAVDSLTIEEHRTIRPWLIASGVLAVLVLAAALVSSLAAQRGRWYRRSRAPK